MEQLDTNRKDKQLLLRFILFVIFQATSVITYTVADCFDLSWTAESLLMAVVCCAVYLSYRSHVKNVMKPLLGATLMLMLYYNMLFALNDIPYLGTTTAIYPNAAAFNASIIFEILLFVTLLLINIMHYVINSTHHSSPGKVTANRVLYILFAVFTFGDCICSLFFGSTALITVSYFCGNIADLFMLATVIIVETSLDKFRIAREAKAEEDEEE